MEDAKWRKLSRSISPDHSSTVNGLLSPFGPSSARSAFNSSLGAGGFSSNSTNFFQSTSESVMVIGVWCSGSSGVIGFGRFAGSFPLPCLSYLYHPPLFRTTVENPSRYTYTPAVNADASPRIRYTGHIIVSERNLKWQ